MPKQFGISGIWKSPKTTIPGLVAGAVGIATALGYISSDQSTTLIALISTFIITLIGLFYKGEECPADTAAPADNPPSQTSA